MDESGPNDFYGASYVFEVPLATLTAATTPEGTPGAPFTLEADATLKIGRNGSEALTEIQILATETEGNASIQELADDVALALAGQGRRCRARNCARTELADEGMAVAPPCPTPGGVNRAQREARVEARGILRRAGTVARRACTVAWLRWRCK